MKKKRQLTATTVFFVILTIVLLAVVNIGYLHLDSGQTFPASNLPSALVGEGDVRQVTGGEAGFLTYGPYLSLSAGTYKLTVTYQTDSDACYLDVYSGTTQTEYAQLPLDSNAQTGNLSFTLTEDVPDMEFRTYYAGQGSLSLVQLHLVSPLDSRAVIGAMVIMDLTILAAAAFAIAWSLHLNPKKTVGFAGLCNRFNARFRK